MTRLIMMVLKNILRLPYYLWKLCVYAKHPEKYPEPERWQHIHKLMGYAVKAGNICLTVTGLENIPKENGFLMVANHQGIFDVIALAALCEQPLSAVYKMELKDVPFVKQVVDATESFAMDRDDVRQSLTVIQKCTEALKNGRNVVIFPEGTRSKNGNVMGEWHGGSFRCAVKAKAPIVPFAVIDSFKVLDQKGIGPVCPQIHFLTPIPFEEYGKLKTNDIAALVKQRVQECIDAHV